MNNKYKICIHAAVWTVMFISPLMFMNHGAGTSWHQFLFMSAVPMSLMIVFYVNYLWLTPKYFATENKQIYWLVNIAMILSMGLRFIYGWTRPMPCSTTGRHNDHQAA